MGTLEDLDMIPYWWTLDQWRLQSNNVVHNARTRAKIIAFGKPSENVKYLEGFIEMMSTLGHHLHVDYITATQVWEKTKKVITTNRKMEVKENDKNFTFSVEEQIEYINNWKADHTEFLEQQIGSTKD